MKKQGIREFTKPKLDELLGIIVPMDWKNPRVYGDFLAQAHYHICHTTRLLAAAGSLFDVKHDELHQQCMKHAGEERSHEKLSTSDIKLIGLKLEDFSELPATTALYRNAYFMIDRMSPLTLFGYAYFLECVGASGKLIEEELQSIYGKKATKHLSLHAHEDPGHIEAYESMLDSMSSEDRRWVEEGIDSTHYHYQRIYHEIIARTQAASGTGSSSGKVRDIKRKAA